ncbi:AraC-like DNA-binding protein [Filimonas zeae]|uniref:Transcriptional regulator n=1 Tax=Filimonas zeae TaxID=1737353 RepID=A0A917MTT9_9BACT|nr:AraC family transcriptional regulator [Filimonas zeae]MDR6337733.1 AraC-like DNA-binding protein [Filimonas zeae]GGH60000.1 transcriptional regulator [Filimonas zeae]
MKYITTNDCAAGGVNMAYPFKDARLLEYGLLIYDSAGLPVQKAFSTSAILYNFSVILVIKGNIQLKVNECSFSLGEQEVIIIPPSSVVEMVGMAAEGRFVSLYFTYDYLKRYSIEGKYFSLSGFIREGVLTSQQVEDRDFGLLLQLLAMLQHLDSGNLNEDDAAIQVNLFKSFLLKIKHYYSESALDRKITATVVYRFHKLLSENFTRYRDVSFYSKKLFMNEKYLSQLLKKKTGKTARQFIIDMVIAEAKGQLSDHAISVKEISGRLNFSNEFHFSRFFRQYVGTSPTQFRNKEIRST